MVQAVAAEGAAPSAPSDARAAATFCAGVLFGVALCWAKGRCGRRRRAAASLPKTAAAGLALPAWRPGGQAAAAPRRPSVNVGCLDALKGVCGRGDHGSRRATDSASPSAAGASAASSSAARAGGQLQKKRVNLLGDFWEGQRKWQRHTSVRELVLSAGQGTTQNHGDTKWLDHLARECWPRIQKYVETLVSETIEPLINRFLPSVLKGSVRFRQVSLGSATPTFGPLEVISSAEASAIECRCGVRLETSDLQVSLTAMGLPIGISKLTLNGRVSVMFRPPLARPPFFGGLEVYMVNAPDIDVEFRGAAQIAQYAYVKPAVRKAIRQVISRVMVLPNRIAVDLDDSDDVDIADLKFPDPLGVLRLTVLRAESLKAADVALPGAEASSDPYVVVKVGAHCWSTSVVKQSLNPSWGDDGAGETHDFLVHDPAQELSVEVFDHDELKSDDIIGTNRRIPLSRLAGRPAGPGGAEGVVRLDLAEPTGEPLPGRLFVSGSWLDLRPRHAEFCAMLFVVKVREVEGLPPGSLFPFKIEASVQGSTAATKNSFAKKAAGAAGPVRALCLEMLHRGECARMVCQTLGLSEEQVMTIRAAGDPDDLGVRKRVREIVDLHAATNPHWQEILHVVAPDAGAGRVGGVVEVKLELHDKADNVLGTTVVNIEPFTDKGLESEGPFTLEPIGAKLIGGVRALFLVDDKVTANSTASSSKPSKLFERMRRSSKSSAAKPMQTSARV